MSLRPLVDDICIKQTTMLNRNCSAMLPASHSQVKLSRTWKIWPGILLCCHVLERAAEELLAEFVILPLLAVLLTRIEVWVYQLSSPWVKELPPLSLAQNREDPGRRRRLGGQEQKGLNSPRTPDEVCFCIHFSFLPISSYLNKFSHPLSCPLSASKACCWVFVYTGSHKEEVLHGIRSLGTWLGNGRGRVSHDTSCWGTLAQQDSAWVIEGRKSLLRREVGGQSSPLENLDQHPRADCSSPFPHNM